MTGDGYRAKALELLARAEAEIGPDLRAEFENLAAGFLRLAEQAERNARFVIEFELPGQNGSDLNPHSDSPHPENDGGQKSEA